MHSPRARGETGRRRPDRAVRVGPLLDPARHIGPGSGAGSPVTSSSSWPEVTAGSPRSPVTSCRRREPRIIDEHYPEHPGGNGPRQRRPRPSTEAEAAFLAIGDGAQRWLAEAAASGAVRIRSKMARAVELAAVVGAERTDAALGLAAIAGRFGDGDLVSIIDHLAAERAPGELVIADEAHSVQPGTAGWASFERRAGR